MPGSKSEKPIQNRPQQAESTPRSSRNVATVPGGKPPSNRLKPLSKQSRGRSPSPASRKKDIATEKKDSELTHGGKGHGESNPKRDDKVEPTHKTRLPHHKAHDKHSEEDGSKCHTSRHSKQHHVDKSDKHKLTKPESVVSSSRSKSPSRSKQTESVEVLEKTNTKGSMEHEKCELIEEQQQPDSDWELSAEEEGDISEHCTDDKPVERISYTKEELMALKTCEVAQQRPAELTDEILTLLSSDANRPKYPATLSLRKEGNESRAFPDISLSPQRGSFSSGCKYKSNRESINKDGSGDAPATPMSSRISEEGTKFSFHDDNKDFSQYRTPHGPQSSSQFSWQRSQSSSTYRDYNGGSASQDDDSNNKPSGRPSYSRYSHSYQHESYRGNGNSRGYYQSESYSEPEPEWMQFGPSSRTEFMELGGEDEIEKMREEFKARQKKVDEALNKNASQNNVETPSDVSDKDAKLVSPTSPDGNSTNDELERNNNVFDNNNYCNDDTMTEQQAGAGKDEVHKMAADSKPPAEEQSLLSANANDEFAVDLNRILNICDDIEEDDHMIHQQQSSIHSEGSQLSKLFSANLPKRSGQHAQFTGDPSNLLMQVLGVQRDDQRNSCQESVEKSLVVGNKPANALTLDEVLAKENISVSGDDQGDQSAFKKLLATIQQQQSPGELSSSHCVMENNRHFNDATHLTNLFSGQERGPACDSLEQYSFSHQHDRVGQPQLDDQSQPLPIGYNRYCRQMEQQQNIGLPHQFYIHDEERMSSKEMCNSEQQRMQQSSLQPPVQRIDQKKLLEQHIQQDVQEHVRQQLLEQQQRQRAAAQFRQQQQQLQQQQQQARMKHQQHLMAIEQQKRAAALSGGAGGMMYSGSVPPPQSHKPPMANQPLGFMPTSVMKHNFKQTRTVPEMNKPSTRLEQDLNQKAVSTHSSLTGLISHSMPEDDHQFLQQDQPRPPYGYSSLPRMSMPPHGGGPRYPMPPPHHPPHHMIGAPPPPGYAMMGPPHHMPPFPSKHNSLPQGAYFNWN